jgi:hypothetical protein
MPRTVDEDELRRYLRSHGEAKTQPVTIRSRYTIAQLREMIGVERIIAREEGHEWTEWRPFHCVEEARSPNRCVMWFPDWHNPICTIIATYVAYHTNRQETLSMCTGHHLHLQAKVN